MMESRGSRSISILISSISVFLIAASAVIAQEQPVSEPISLSRRVVEKVEFAGVYSFDESEIKGLLSTKPNRWYNIFKKKELSKSNVKLDEGVIRRFYGRRGFLFAEVNSIIGRTEGNKAIVTFIVSEGKRVFLSHIRIDRGLEDINRRFDKLLDDFKIREPVNSEQLASGGFKLRDLYFDNGYPYTKIFSRFEFNYDSTQASVAYVIEESLATVYGQTMAPGDMYTKPYVVRRELLNKPGQLYRERDIIDSEQRLYSLGLFRLVNLRREDATVLIVNDTCHVNFSLNLRERKSYFMNFGIGLGRQDQFPLVLRSSALWGNRNIFGTSRKIILAVRPYFRITKAGGLESPNLSDIGKDIRFSLVRSTFELNYITPWMFDWRIPVASRIFYEPYTLNPDPEYRYDRMAGEVIFSRKIDKFTTGRVTLYTEYINIRNIPSEQEDEFRRQYGDNPIRRRFLIYGERDTRDNILVPQKGSFSFAGVDFVGGPLGGDFSYIKTQAMWSRFNLISGRNILASRIWLGFLDDRFDGGRSAPDDRFMAGGSSTIRGFEESDLGPKLIIDNEPTPAGGRYLIIGNVEIRRPLFWLVGGTVFFDAGNTYSRWEEITPESIQLVPGLGLQFFTPIGPIRFDYGVKLQKQFDLGVGLYHLAILYAF